MSTTDQRTIQATDAIEGGIGQTLGRYKLLEKIGEGGFGVVYVAEQKEPVKRRIALKIIKLGMDTRQVVARFEAERQALALMDHPNIAKVLDAGATDTGRPYFVMELVRGVRLTDYCDQHKLSTRQRLELFIHVCQAIQHAHQKGIIHRDIKPSNILVTLHDGVPVPKVIDFGIAKATQQDLTDKTLYTQLQQFIGTPAYMSPEQAEMSGLDIDTRSDIYSLGVLLYELLTGRTPFDAKELMSLGIEAMRKTIREKEPVRPSSKVATLQDEELSTTAARCSTEAPKLINLLRGDLDWIVMKCLEKDRTRRYETANGLAADLKRHLTDEPVVARPPSTAYRVQKAFRRNKLVFGAAAAIAAALILGIIGATLGLLHAKQAQALTLQTRNDAEKLSNFMLDDFYAKLEPSGDFEIVSRLANQAVAYYDSLPRSLRTPETERNRQMARARLALVIAKQGDFKTAIPLAEDASARLEQMRKAGDVTEATIYSLGLALEAEYWCSRGQLSGRSEVITLHKAAEVLRPLANSPQGSARVKLEYANLLNCVSHLEATPAQGIAACEEALRILAGIGALDLSNLNAASTWADTADSEARITFNLGRLDNAERLEKQVHQRAEGVLARRPGDLHARQDLYYVPDLLGLIEAKRFHDDAALQFFSQGRQACQEYLRFNPSDAEALRPLSQADHDIAVMLFRSGRVAEALREARASAQRVGDRNIAANLFQAVLLLDIAAWEAQRGDRPAADHALQEAAQKLESSASLNQITDARRERLMNVLHAAERRVSLAFGDYATVLAMAKDTVTGLEKSAEQRNSQEDGPRLILQKKQALSEATRAALNLGHFTEAETTARVLGSLAQPSATSTAAERLFLEEPDDAGWGRVLLAQALVAQGRREDALTTVDPALAHYHEMHVQGATHLSFRQHFARALYVQALAQPADASGISKRRDLLDEAARSLNELSDEARQLHDTKELFGWVEAERQKLSQEASQ